MGVSIQPGSRFAASNPQVIFEGEYPAPAILRNYDVSPDGKRFLMIQRDPGSVPRQLNVILNWSAEPDRPAPAGNK